MMTATEIDRQLVIDPVHHLGGELQLVFVQKSI